jgi:hypothetical protein
VKCVSAAVSCARRMKKQPSETSQHERRLGMDSNV